MDQSRVLSLRLVNIHADDLRAVEAIDVVQGTIHDHFAVEIAHDLMDVYDDSAVGQQFESLWLYNGVNHVPLARPIFAHTGMAANPAALHPIGPIHVGMQEQHHKIKVALVEGVVDRLQ